MALGRGFGPGHYRRTHMKAKGGPDVSKMVKSNRDTAKNEKRHPAPKDGHRMTGKKPKMG